LQQLIAEQKKVIDELKQKLDAEYSRVKGEFAEKGEDRKLIPPYCVYSKNSL
jgi:uncharacterized coiled-coil protein SlyX